MKISQEHLERLQKMHSDRQNIKNELANVTIDIAGLKARQSHLITINDSLDQQDQEFSAEIKNTYGEVKSINIQTGEFELSES